MADDQPVAETTSGKVARVIEDYDLVGIGADLEAHWTASEDRKSLRELAAYFNKAVLRACLDEHDADTLSGDVDSLYEQLTGEDVTSGVRVEAENRLRQHDIDVDRLRSDFVSRQAIHTYLTKHREAAFEPADDEAIVERRREELQRLTSRHRTVTERTLSSLRDSDRLSLGEFQVLVSARVQCTDCMTQYEVDELIERGGCDCST